jgi:hypothetical protein
MSARTCRTCGSIYTDTAGGRHTHKVLFGHAPSPEREATWDQLGGTPKGAENG